jgi:GTPase SAR1 family protein
MLSVRIWNLESDHDAQVVKFLEDEFVNFRRLGDLAIRTAGRSALRKCHKKGAPLRESLRKAIQHYLAQDDYIIFVVDSDQQKSSPLVDHLRHIVKDCDLSDRVFFMPEVPEDKSAKATQWQNIISRFQTEVESERKRLREEWDRAIAYFHNAFADIPEEEVRHHFEEALAEVRRERT